MFGYNKSFNYQNYADLIKPDWAPPSWLFGPVWSVLYIIIAYTFGFVAYQTYLGKLPGYVLLPFALNLFFNLIFTPLQFGLKNNLLAAVDIVLILITLAWALKVIWPYYGWVAIANLPHLVWVSFATITQLTITYLNISK
jgi:tryptophan-rich sensory protein